MGGGAGSGRRSRPPRWGCPEVPDLYHLTWRLRSHSRLLRCLGLLLPAPCSILSATFPPRSVGHVVAAIPLYLFRCSSASDRISRFSPPALGESFITLRASFVADG